MQAWLQRLAPAQWRSFDETEIGLLATVAARPRDDRPRLVFADYLRAGGDPYGEFIALQVRGRTAATIRQVDSCDRSPRRLDIELLESLGGLSKVDELSASGDEEALMGFLNELTETQVVKRLQAIRLRLARSFSNEGSLPVREAIDRLTQTRRTLSVWLDPA